jgi:transcriptional regulator with XRE-family HTH domain
MNLRAKIEKLCDEHNVSLKKLASQIPIAEQTLHRNMKRNSMESKYLTRIAEIFQINATYFFDDSNDEIIVNEEKVPYGNKDYLKCLEELREVNQENRELNKEIRKLREELEAQKNRKTESKQKTTVTK